MTIRQDGVADEIAKAPVNRLPIVTADGSIPGAGIAVGIALEFQDGIFAIAISDAEDRAVLTFGPYEEHEVIAIWRSMASSSGLPLLLAGPDGALQQPYPQMGRLLLGEKKDRRRLAVLSGRRPRFLARRKSSRLPRRPLVYRERVIAEGRAP